MLVSSPNIFNPKKKKKTRVKHADLSQQFGNKQGHS